MIIVAHNLASLNAMRQFGINTQKQNKSSERLASGYRVNRAADDAAGLAISEKLRRQIRGLNQGTRNAQDGISWVQIGDGALNEVDDMLHRMTELTIQSLNDTYTAEDRAYMEAEFDQLQSEIDNIAKNTKFNDQNIFAEHEPTFYQIEGNAVWPHEEVHNVISPNNTLTITYMKEPDSDPESVTITVPDGDYTTQELADELEEAIAKSPLSSDPRLVMEYTENGTFNANLEGGAKIDSVDGPLSSLLYETYLGGAVGSLIGTTIFPSDSSYLQITAGKNDTMNFVIEDFSGGKTTKSLTLSPGYYNRQQLIDKLNEKLVGTGVEATKYGTGIMLSSEDHIISQFKGNMFQIDGPSYTSVFYDNVYHGEVNLTPSVFTGGAVLPSSAYANGRDEEHRYYNIVSGENDTLKFKPNGSDTEVSITIPEGRYEMGAMVTKLNDLFQGAGLALTATSHSSNNFAGITITSKVKGATSDVGIDNTSSAFNTLFVDKNYNVYSAKTAINNETTADRTAYFYGGKGFSNSSYNNTPLTIESGKNDKFNLNIDGSQFTVTLAAGTYTTADAIKNVVSNAISGDKLGAYAGQVNVTTVGNGQIEFYPTTSSNIVSLTASAISGNNGYNEIFRANYKMTEKVLSGQQVTLDRTFPDPTAISESEKTIVVEPTNGGNSYTINLPTGDNVTHAQIKEAIESSEGTVKYTDKVFTPYSTSGRDNNFTISGTGSTSTSNRTYNSTGTTVGGGIEGQVGTSYSVNNPAKVAVDLKSSFTPATGSDQFRITLNGTTQTFTFDHIQYTPQTFAAALQSKIDSAYGNKYGGATVQASGNSIVITSRLADAYGVDMPASTTSISCGTATSSLLSELNTTRTAATATIPSNGTLNTSGINVSAGDTFVFKVNNETKTVTLNALSNGTLSQFASMLNNCMAGTGATAELSVNGIKLTSTAVGSGNTISYSSANGGTVSNALYTNMQTQGTAYTSLNMQDSIDIESGKNVFRYSVDGTAKSLEIPAGHYTPATLVSALNTKLSGATASIYSGKLRLTSNSKGTGSSIGLSYDSAADSAMRAIFGRNELRTPALEADFDDTDHLILKSKDGSTFRIRSSSGGLVEQEKVTTYASVYQNTGYHSAKHSNMDGGNLTISSSSPLVINEWNDDLKFNYFKDDVAKAASIKVDHGTYTSYDQLRDNLQSKIDAALGSGEMTVTVDEQGVNIKADKVGSTRKIGSVNYSSVVTTSNDFGDFYDKVMNAATEKLEKLSTSKTLGSNVAGNDKLPYTNGRRNVKDSPVKLKSDINDALSLDFEYTDENGVKQKKTFNMKLDEGTYQGDSLARMVQSKLNEQLVAAGLAENFIEVGIGGTNANVAGVDNSKVLTFKLTNSLPLPSSGEYIIDGIGGNASFSIFYQTTGDLIPAYVEGVKDVSNGVAIDDTNNILKFTTDGTNYEIEIPEGEYTGDEIFDKLNEVLTGANAPVKAEKTEDGRIRLSQKKMGNHPITNLSGPARGGLFFNEYNGDNEDNGITLQLSGEVGHTKDIDRPAMTTSFLGINSVGITKPKYATKALDRVKGALDKASEVRAYFGATQNALEHIINNNNNVEENLTSAESRIRDTDMAKTMVEHANHDILLKAGQAMMTKANQDSEMVLNLLG